MPATSEVTAPKNTTTTTTTKKSSSSSLYTFPRCKASGGRRNRPGSDEEECKASQAAAVPALLNNSKWCAFVRRLENKRGSIEAFLFDETGGRGVHIFFWYRPGPPSVGVYIFHTYIV